MEIESLTNFADAAKLAFLQGGVLPSSPQPHLKEADHADDKHCPPRGQRLTHRGLFEYSLFLS